MPARARSISSASTPLACAAATWASRANSATLLDLHSDRDSLGDLAAEFRSLHCPAELQIAAQHSGRMSHRRDHVTDLSVTVHEFGEKVFRCTDSGGGRERSKARHNES